MTPAATFTDRYPEVPRSSIPKIKRIDQRPLKEALLAKNKFKFLGLTADEIIHYFFAGNATVSIIVLFAICLSLLRDGWGFLPAEYQSLELYRKSGLEYVNYVREQTDIFVPITREINEIYSNQSTELWDKYGQDNEGTWEKVTAEMKPFTDWKRDFNAAIRPIEKIRKEWTTIAAGTKSRHYKNEESRSIIENSEKAMNTLSAAVQTAQSGAKTRNWYETQAKKLNLGDDIGILIRDASDATVTKEIFIKQVEADIQSKRDTIKEETANIQPIDFAARFEPLRNALPKYKEVNEQVKAELERLVVHLPELPNKKDEDRLKTIGARVENYVAKTKIFEQKLINFELQREISYLAPVGEFFLGTQWTTQSEFQDYFGFLPLFSGSLMISILALLIGVPISVAAAIYVNQIATPWEQNIIKPYIEFIEVIPSIVLGFFGIAVVGQTLRWLSFGAPVEDVAWSWAPFETMFWWFFTGLEAVTEPISIGVPFFPFQNRLNVATASVLLAVMAIPTIFTLTEDALNNVPRHFKEGALALGATRLQTIVKIMIPAALSGIISAILLGFGRVIGETMVVLLCAGGRIALPDFSKGLGVFFEPTHTMTGIIAQEMGEVTYYSLHFHALFMIGLVLFFIALIINYLAQFIVGRYKIHGG